MIGNVEEKIGGMRILNSSSITINEIIKDLHFVDISPNNRIHTWNNRWGGVHQVTFPLVHFLLSDNLI